MNLNRVIYISGVLILLLALLVICLWPKEKAPQPIGTELAISSHPTQTYSVPVQSGRSLTKEEVDRIQKEKRQKVVNQVEAMLNTPISFYGKVVDQNNVPVPGALVAYSLLDKFDASGTNARKSADDLGYFEISGVKGAVLGVNVSKEGYYQIHNVSNQRFAYGTGPDGYSKKPPTKDKPAIFVLQKMGKTEPLIYIDSRTFRVPRNGSPITVDLTTGQISNNGQLKVEAWTNDQSPDEQNHYDWMCRLSVPGGGLADKIGEFDFEAPTEGYQQFKEISMPQATDRWQPQAERQYFIRLADNRFARIRFKMIAQGDHFFRMESYLNPRPDSRNLEYDSAKQIKP